MTREKVVICFEALGNSTRLDILRLLIKAGHSGLKVGDIQKKLTIPASTLSHHLSQLMRAEIISQVRQSRTLFCHANFKIVREILQFFSEDCCVGAL